MFKYLIREACAVFILMIENMTVKVTSKDFSCGVVIKGSFLTLVKKSFTGCDSFTQCKVFLFNYPTKENALNYKNDLQQRRALTGLQACIVTH